MNTGGGPLMRCFKGIIVSFFFLFSQIHGNEIPRAHTDIPATTAKSVALFLNSIRSFNQLIELTSKFLPPEDSEGIRKQFKRLNIDLNQKIPIVRAVGSKLVFKDFRGEVQLNEDMNLIIRGRTYNPRSQADISDQVKKFIDDLSSTSTSKINILINQAEAATLVDKSVAIAGMAAVYFSSIAALNWAGATFSLGVGFGMVGLPLIAFGGMIWLGKEIYETVRDGEVDCHGKNFQVRKKSRALMLIPANEASTIDSNVVKTMLGTPNSVECTPASAKELQKLLKNSTDNETLLKKFSQKSTDKGLKPKGSK